MISKLLVCHQEFGMIPGQANKATVVPACAVAGEKPLVGRFGGQIGNDEAMSGFILVTGLVLKSG